MKLVSVKPWKMNSNHIMIWRVIYSDNSMTATGNIIIPILGSANWGKGSYGFYKKFLYYPNQYRCFSGLAFFAISVNM